MITRHWVSSSRSTAADKMRGHLDASEYKHICLGLIFLKYFSDAFEEKRGQLPAGFASRSQGRFCARPEGTSPIRRSL
jgi:type I restriction-modification system DNA methylase subunit